MRKLIALALLAAATNAAAATVAEWRSDLDQIVADIRSIHPAPFTKVGELTFRRRVAALEEALPSLTEEQRVVEAMRIVASIGDGHTQLQPKRPDFGSWYPVRFYQFTDGYFITTAHRSVAELAGAQVLEIAGRPVDEVASAARGLMGADNAMGAMENLFALHNASLMKGLGYASADGRLVLRVKLRNGTIVERTLTPHATDDPRFDKDDSTFEWRFRREFLGSGVGTPADWVSALRDTPGSAFATDDPARPAHLGKRALLFTRRLDDTFYIQAITVSRSVADDFIAALRTVDEIKPKRLIVDLRYNFGGDGSVVDPVMHEIIRRESAPPWGELYLLVGRKTFSAGLGWADEFIRHTNATIIGEPAGAAMNSYGDPVERDFPKTGLVLEVSSLRHDMANSDDVREFVPVDIPAPFSFADYVSGRDPAVDPIVRGEEMRSIGRIARTDGGAAARKAYFDRVKRFSTFSWWTPPPEIDLRHACNDLLDGKRTADALEVCTLNTEIHPFVWNTWLNLAHVQRLAGMTRESFENLQHVLQIDPTNFNEPDIRNAARDALRPPVVRFGSSVAEMQKALAGSCAPMKTRVIDPPFLTDVKQQQLQIDCEGFQYLGKPRHAEFAFRDDQLELVWIMTTPEEADFIASLMRTAFRVEPNRNAQYVSIAGEKIALRSKPAEVLLYSSGIAAQYEPDFR
ncbi:MAG TPA: hypothetical protein VGJ82_07175 [Thermoanaerobaculia bacterium]